jgi:hypothetical protein
MVVRVSRDEMREIERMASAMGITKSDYCRAAIGLGIPSALQAPGGISPARLDAIEAAIARIGITLDKLAQLIEAQTRHVTFREWRVRAEVAGDEMPRKDAEQAREWMLRQARTYHAHTGKWPVPDLPSLRTFGAFSPDPDFLKRWPVTPPGR